MLRPEDMRTVSRPADQKPKRLIHLPGQMIMRIREAPVAAAMGASTLHMTASDSKRLPEAVSEVVGYLERNAGLKSIEPVFSKRRQALGRASVSSKVRRRLAPLTAVRDAPREQLRGYTTVHVDPKRVTPRLLRMLGKSPGVEFIEPAPARWLAAADPMLNRQWGLRAIDWFNARRPRADGVSVAVIDTGIDRNHPDLKDAVSAYHHAGLSGSDLVGHGSHVAGIIAAIVNNGEGIAGVADCWIEAWKVFDDQPTNGEFYVNIDHYLQALQDVLESEFVWVVNLSLGGTESSRIEQTLFRMLAEADKVVVAAMGNEYAEGNPTEYPAAYDGVFAVGSVDETLRRSWFSNTGRHIDLVAPGSNILSTLPTRGSRYLDETDYAAWSGTSMATPHVAGAAALVSAKHPDWSAAQVKHRLEATARRVPMMRGSAGNSEAYGHGLVDLKKALA